jgi:hypothetical protein
MPWTHVPAKDSQTAEMLQLLEEHIALAFRIPLAILGMGKTPVSSTEALMGMWLASGLGFALSHIEESLGLLFRLRGQPEDYVEFDTTALLRTQQKDRIEMLAPQKICPQSSTAASRVSKCRLYGPTGSMRSSTMDIASRFAGSATPCGFSRGVATTGLVAILRSQTPQPSFEPRRSSSTARRSSAVRTALRCSMRCTVMGPSATRCAMYSTSSKLDGEDLRSLPLGDRKNRLARLVGKRRLGIVPSEHTDEDGPSATDLRNGLDAEIERSHP